MASKIYNVFISHSWSHVEDLKNLKDLLENRGYFKVEFKESSPENPINSDKSAYIRAVLKQKILESNIVLGIAGVYATYSDWMRWELGVAYNNDIPIVGVIPWGQERISTVVNEHSIINVRWNTESIVDAIREHSR